MKSLVCVLSGAVACAPAVSNTAAPCPPAAVIEVASPPPKPAAQPTISIDLPRAQPRDFGEVQAIFAVWIAADGQLLVDGKRVTDAELVAAARAAYGKDSGMRALIHADRRVPWEGVVRVLDVLRRTGFDKIAFGIAPAAVP